MVQCEFCLNFDGAKCIEPKGAKYGKVIEDSYEEIDTHIIWRKDLLVR